MRGSTVAEFVRAWRWLWWTALSFPVAVLSHELAHFAAYLFFRFQEPTIHYGSASFVGDDTFWERMNAGDIAGATRIVVPWQAGTAAAAGLLATYVAVVSCVLIARRRPHPFLVGLGLIAPLRFLGSVVVVVAFLLGRRGDFGSDEEHVATTLHIPELALHLLGIVVLAAAWAILMRLPALGTRRVKAAVLGGIVVGGVLYIGVLGPWLLP